MKDIVGSFVTTSESPAIASLTQDILSGTLDGTKFDADFILLGKDREGKVCLCTLDGPSNGPAFHDDISFATIGSGWPHAFVALRELLPLRGAATLASAVHAVYRAKKLSSMQAIGIGEKTDLAVMTPDGTGPVFLKEEDLKELDRLCEKLKPPPLAAEDEQWLAARLRSRLSQDNQGGQKA